MNLLLIYSHSQLFDLYYFYILAHLFVLCCDCNFFLYNLPTFPVKFSLVMHPKKYMYIPNPSFVYVIIIIILLFFFF